MAAVELGNSLDVREVIRERLESRVSRGFLAPAAWVGIDVLHQ